VRFLIGRGVPAKRLSALGVGPDRPIADNATPEGRKANRRVDFKLLSE
jgi:OOP family OmpA-OmpF porin